MEAALGPIANLADAVTCHHLNEDDEAVRHLTGVVDARIGNCVFLGADPVHSKMRGHAGYDALVRRIGVPLPQTASAPHTAST